MAVFHELLSNFFKDLFKVKPTKYNIIHDYIVDDLLGGRVSMGEQVFVRELDIRDFDCAFLFINLSAIVEYLEMDVQNRKESEIINEFVEHLKIKFPDYDIDKMDIEIHYATKNKFTSKNLSK